MCALNNKYNSFQQNQFYFSKGLFLEHMEM